MQLSRCLARDRLSSIALDIALPERDDGAVLVADIAGFTALGAALARELGERRGAEALAERLDAVYESLIDTLQARGGVVVGFAGDAMTCWFAGGGDAAAHALAAASALHAACGAHPGVGLKIAVCSGSVRRLAVGDPDIQRLDTLAGAVIDRLGIAETLCGIGEVLVDEATLRRLPAGASVLERRGTEPGPLFWLVRPLAANAAAAPPRPAPKVPAQRLRPWILPALFEREKGGHAAFHREMRPVAVVFIRFEGIDYDSDDAPVQLDRTTRVLQAIAKKQDGVLLQLTLGDKGSYAFLCFGAPIAHEDDGARAVRSAWEARESLRTLPFIGAVHLGVASGMVRAGAYGSPLRATYGVVGDAINLAARLMAAAGAGEILLAPELKAPAEREFALRAAPAQRMKGRSETIRPLILGAPVDTYGLALQEPHDTQPFIGRQAELQRMAAALDEIKAGQGCSIRIQGVAGIGKSRLLGALARQARERGFAVIGGVCTPAGATSPYAVWRSIGRYVFELDGRPAWARGRIEARLRALAPHRLNVLPVLSAVLGEPLPDNDHTRSLQPEDRRDLLAAILRDVLSSAAAQRPLLVLVEDTHWIDDLSAQLLTRLVRSLAGAAVGFAQTSRTHASETPADAAGRVIDIALAPLAEVDQRALLLQRLAPHGLPQARAEALTRMFTERAHGNIFYLEELVSYAQQSGLLQSDANDLAGHLPNSLHALVLSRIDQLPETHRSLLKAASVIGRSFELRWLPDLYPQAASPSMEAILCELNALDLTRMDVGAGVCQFRHAIIREVVYESMPRALRAQLHERFARALEARDAERHLDLLAHHYGQSTNAGKQREYFLRAAQAAQAMYANSAALAHFDRLLALQIAPAELFEAMLGRAKVLHHVGRIEAGEAMGLEAISLARQRLDTRAQARAQLQVGNILDTKDCQAAVPHLEAASELFRAVGDASGQAQALALAGVMHMYLGAPEIARARAQESVDVARTSADRDVLSTALNSRLLVAQHEGDVKLARAVFREISALCRKRGGDRRRLATAINNLGYVERRAGRLAAARKLYARCHALALEIGYTRIIHISALAMANIMTDSGDHAGARSLLEERVAACHADGADPFTLGRVIGDLGYCLLCAGELDLAQRYLEESVAILRPLGADWAIGVENLGCVMLERGDAARAAPLLHEALEQRHRGNDAHGVVDSLVDHVVLLALRGQWRAAAMIAAAAQVLGKQHGVSLGSLSRRTRDRALGETRAHLPQREYRAAWREGCAMTLAQAVGAALAHSAPAVPAA